MDVGWWNEPWRECGRRRCWWLLAEGLRFLRVLESPPMFSAALIVACTPCSLATLLVLTSRSRGNGSGLRAGAASESSSLASGSSTKSFACPWRSTPP